MTVTAIEKRQEPAALSMKGLESALLDADLGKMSEPQRVAYYSKVCESLGLNPLTQPFEYIKLNGKLVLYARRSCTEQLRKLYGVSLEITSRAKVDGLYVVGARATTPDGRTDESIGAVPVEGLKGENLSNALMKAETKAKRRVTLSICGLAFLDESEAEGLRPQREQLPAKTSEQRLDEIARGGERAETRPTEASGSSRETSTQTGSSATRPMASGSSDSFPNSTTDGVAGASAQTGTVAADGELLDAVAWRKRYELLIEELSEKSNWIVQQDDEYQLPIPPVECPSFGPDGRRLANKRFDDPSVGVGFLRKRAQEEAFETASADKRAWTLYLIARHELAKESGNV